MTTTQTLESDADLAGRVATGPDPTGAFARLYERHHARLEAFVRTRFQDIADDLVQDTWVKALDNLAKAPRNMTNFRSWLFTIANHLAMDFYRRRAPKPLDPGANPADGSPSALDGLLEGELRKAVEKCLERLNAALQAVVRAITGGEAADEVGRRLGISTDVVYQRKSRGLAALRECVEARLP